MTIIIQAFVVIMALTVMVTALGKRTTHVGKASKKLGLVVLGAAMIIAVIFPETTNAVAHAVGVGRGADLLLYVTVVAFILYAVNNYLQMHDQRDMLYRLARRVAIIEAKNKGRKP
jgi:hypothetical protein